MRILVCVKIVAGELNPFDACALEAALTLADERVTVLSMCPPSATERLKQLTRLGDIDVIQLSDSAKRAIIEYSWPGNIRQLKNIAEQISILELNREIDAAVIANYLPKEQKNNLPTFAGHKSDSKTFESEREILYSVLFDMRRDITELKKQIEILRTSHEKAPAPYYTETSELPVVQHQIQPSYQIQPSQVHYDPVEHVVEEYIEETLSLDDVEKKTILQALERNKGKRRHAAKELNISERTLYRKIKEYGIE